MSTYFATVLVLIPDDVAPGLGEGDAKDDPALLVGILEGVPSSLISDKVDPCRDAGLEWPGVKLDLTGIDVLVVNVVVKVLDGVRRPNEAESDWSESAVEPVRDFVVRSRVV